MRYEAILFDMDGVLIEGRETHPSVYQTATKRLLQAFGQSIDGAIPPSLAYPATASGFLETCEQYQLPPQYAWDYRERAASDIANRRLSAGKRTAYSDTEVLTSLDSRDYILGICSNNRHETVAHCIDTFEWDGQISAYRGRFPNLEDFERRKPDPSYLRWVIERLDVDSALFVGDRLTDVEAAERLGLDAALLTRDGSRPEGTVTPRYHIQTLSDLQTLADSDWNPSTANL